MTSVPIAERNQDATVYVGGLDERVTEEILWELFLQGGPVVSVHMPKDRVTQQHQNYGFVEFLGEKDADYAIKVMNMIKLYGKSIRVNKPSTHHKNLDVGANLFIGNLDPEIDEKYLYDTFSAFGVILQTPKIMRDPETGNSKGFAFINFASFDASDAAFDAMNGQFLCNRAIRVTYAFKKDGKGERHGSAAERLLAAKKPVIQDDRPHQQFADAPTNNIVEIPPVIHDGANPLMGNGILPRYPFSGHPHPSHLPPLPGGPPQMQPRAPFGAPLHMGPPANMHGVGLHRQPVPQVPPSLMNPSFIPHQPPNPHMPPEFQFQHPHNSNFRERPPMPQFPHQNFHQSAVAMPHMHGMIPQPPTMHMPQHGGYPRPPSPPQSSVNRLPPPPMYSN